MLYTRYPMPDVPCKPRFNTLYNVHKLPTRACNFRKTPLMEGVQLNLSTSFDQTQHFVVDGGCYASNPNRASGT